MDKKPVRLTADHIDRTIASFSEEIRTNPSRLCFTLAMTVIKHFFGAEWVEAHIIHTTAKPGFLRLDFSSDEKRERQSFKVIELAETLFNLQNIDGFDECIATMKGEQVESTYAELDFGRFLYIHDVDFRFVIPKQKKGDDYDVELTYPDGTIVCADAKCRIEAAEINPDAVRNSLDHARGQLPSNRPGIVFVKVPQSWIAIPTMGAALSNVARQFLRSTKRVVSVKYYSSILTIESARIRHRHAFREISNLNNKFAPQRNWDLFTNYVVPEGWNGMPPKWVRIFAFMMEPHRHG